VRLLRIIASMDPVKGGPCQGIRNSIPELERLGVHNEVACLDSPNALFLKKDSFIIHPLGPGKTPWCYSSRLIPWLLKNLNRFDAVIVHGLWLYPGYAVKKSVKMLAQRQGGPSKEGGRIPRIFIMPHGMLDPYFQQASERKLKAIRNWIYWKFIESRVVNEASGLLFTCDGELALARVPFRPYRPLQEVNVGYGIADPPVYSAQMRKTFLEICPEVGAFPYILFLGRIHEKKGVDLLIRAYLKIVSEAINGMKVHRSKYSSNETNSSNGHIKVPKLVIAGPGIETTYGQRMLCLAHRNKLLEHSILFPGMLTGDAKWGAYYGCEAFILPSHQENFGIAVVEAMACSKPVLISNQINIWKEIQDEGAGVVSDDALCDLQIKLKSWCNMTSVEKLEMGRRARTCYENKFSIGPVANRLITAIKG
jgi:glycosyltransferase involved in cell wall biosynthesis